MKIDGINIFYRSHIKMKERFCSRKIPELRFEWNAANQFDWPIIRRNFVAAYISSYQNRSAEELNFNHEYYQQAEQQFNGSYQKGLKEGFDVLFEEMIRPLQFYLHHGVNALEKECVELKKHLSDSSFDISLIREKIIKLMMLQNYFEAEFKEEIQKIKSEAKNIDYLIVRFHDQPIAFFVSQLNYKSSHVYLRFVTVEPAFQRLGLGEKALEEIEKHYPDTTGMELYTRKANSARSFYTHCGLQEYTQFDFDQPTLTKNNDATLHLPEDDATTHPDAFIAFSGRQRAYRA